MIDLSTLAIPSVDVVPEPTISDWVYFLTKLDCQDQINRLVYGLVRHYRQLETQAEKRITELKVKVKELQMDSENYHGRCGICATANKDMLTDSYCAACEVERLRKLPYGPDLPEKFHDE
jgi:hypothetical protein